MDREQFWKVIEKARKGTEGDLEQFLEQLKMQLSSLPPKAIIEFEKVRRQYFNEAYTWELWGAAHILFGGCSDDGFAYFRAGLVAYGQKVYETATKNADSLSKLEEPPEECEEMMYVSREVYEEVTGEEMPDIPDKHPDEPTGQKWTEDDLPKLLPRLSEKYA